MADESKTGILGHLPPLPRPALHNSVIGMEQAYRQRKGLTLLTDADIEALKAGQPHSVGSRRRGFFTGSSSRSSLHSCTTRRGTSSRGSFVRGRRGHQ